MKDMGGIMKELNSLYGESTKKIVGKYFVEPKICVILP